MSRNNNIVIPFGWRRQLEKEPGTSLGTVNYISPSDVVLSSIAEVCQYLENDTTCKCGLQCPLHVSKVFNFNPEVHSLELTKKEWGDWGSRTDLHNRKCIHWNKLHKTISGKKKISSTKDECEPPPKLLIIRKEGRLTSIIPDTARSKKEVSIRKKRPTFADTIIPTKSDAMVSIRKGSASLRSPLFETGSTSIAKNDKTTDESKSDFKLQWIKAEDELSHNDSESGNELCFSPDFKKSPPTSFPQLSLSGIISPTAAHVKLEGRQCMNNATHGYFMHSANSGLMSTHMGVEPIHRFGMSAFPGSNFVTRSNSGIGSNNMSPYPHQVPRYPVMSIKSEQQDLQSSQLGQTGMPTAAFGLPHSNSFVKPQSTVYVHERMQWNMNQQRFPTTNNIKQQNYDGTQVGPRVHMQCVRQPVSNHQYPLCSPPPCHSASSYSSVTPGHTMPLSSPVHGTNQSPFSNKSNSSFGTPTPSPLSSGPRQSSRMGYTQDSSRPLSRSSNTSTPRPDMAPSPMSQWNTGMTGGYSVRTPGSARSYTSDISPGPLSPPFSPQRFSQPVRFPQNIVEQQISQQPFQEYSSGQPMVNNRFLNPHLMQQQAYNIAASNMQQRAPPPPFPSNSSQQFVQHINLQNNHPNQRLTVPDMVESNTMGGQNFPPNLQYRPTRIQFAKINEPESNMQQRFSLQTTQPHNMSSHTQLQDPGYLQRVQTNMKWHPGNPRVPTLHNPYQQIIMSRPRQMTYSQPTKPKRQRKRKTSKASVTKAEQVPAVNTSYVSCELSEFFNPQQNQQTLVPEKTLMASAGYLGIGQPGSNIDSQYLAVRQEEPVIPLTHIEQQIDQSPSLVIPQVLHISNTTGSSASLDVRDISSTRAYSSITSTENAIGMSLNSVATSPAFNNQTVTDHKQSGRGVITPPLPLLSPSLMLDEASPDSDDFSDFANPPAVFDFPSSFSEPKGIAATYLTPSSNLGREKLKINPTKSIESAKVSQTPPKTTSSFVFHYQPTITAISISSTKDPGLFSDSRHTSFQHSLSKMDNTLLVSSSGKVFRMNANNHKYRRLSDNLSVEPTSTLQSDTRKRVWSDPYSWNSQVSSEMVLNRQQQHSVCKNFRLNQEICNKQNAEDRPSPYSAPNLIKPAAGEKLSDKNPHSLHSEQGLSAAKVTSNPRVSVSAIPRFENSSITSFTSSKLNTMNVTIKKGSTGLDNIKTVPLPSSVSIQSKILDCETKKKNSNTLPTSPHVLMQVTSQEGKPETDNLQMKSGSVTHVSVTSPIVCSSNSFLSTRCAGTNLEKVKVQETSICQHSKALNAEGDNSINKSKMVFTTEEVPDTSYRHQVETSNVQENTISGSIGMDNITATAIRSFPLCSSRGSTVSITKTDILSNPDRKIHGIEEKCPTNLSVSATQNNLLKGVAVETYSTNSSPPMPIKDSSKEILNPTFCNTLSHRENIQEESVTKYPEKNIYDDKCILSDSKATSLTDVISKTEDRVSTTVACSVDDSNQCHELSVDFSNRKQYETDKIDAVSDSVKCCKQSQIISENKSPPSCDIMVVDTEDKNVITKNDSPIRFSQQCDTREKEQICGSTVEFNQHGFTKEEELISNPSDPIEKIDSNGEVLDDRAICNRDHTEPEHEEKSESQNKPIASNISPWLDDDNTSTQLKSIPANEKASHFKDDTESGLTECDNVDMAEDIRGDGCVSQDENITDSDKNYSQSIMQDKNSDKNSVKCVSKSQLISINEDDTIADNRILEDLKTYQDEKKFMELPKPSSTSSVALGISPELTDTVIRQLSNYNTILKNLLVSGVGPVNATALAQLTSNDNNSEEQKTEMISTLITNNMQMNMLQSPAMLQKTSILPGTSLVGASSSLIDVTQDQTKAENTAITSNFANRFIHQHDKSYNASVVQRASNVCHLRDYADGTVVTGSSEFPASKLPDNSCIGDSSVQRNSERLCNFSSQPHSISNAIQIDERKRSGLSSSSVNEATSSSNQGLQVPIVSSSVKGTHTEDVSGNEEVDKIKRILDRENQSTPNMPDQVSTSIKDADITQGLPSKDSTSTLSPVVNSTAYPPQRERRRGRTRNSAGKKNERSTTELPREKVQKRSMASNGVQMPSNLRPIHRSTEKQTRIFKSGDLVWGQMRGFPSWPGKIVKPSEVRSLQQRAPLSDGKAWVKWFGDHTFTQMNPADLRTMTEGLEAHHKSRKKGRTRNRKISIHLETAIQEAVDELEQQQDLKQGNIKKLLSIAPANAPVVEQHVIEVAETSKSRRCKRKKR